jgi:archaellum component FlaF (FlaF/FlaG flagellin family)
MTAGDQDSSRITVRISATSNRIRVVAQDRQDVVVDGDAAVRHDGSCTTVDSIGGRVVVWVPEGTDLVLGTTSARVTVEGPVGRVAVVTESGRINVADATSADIRTNSARVEVGRTSADCCVRTSSGRVTIGACGSADVTTKSGRIVVEAASGPVQAHCVSGRVEIALTTAEDIDAETVSGQIRVTVPHGVAVHTNDDLTVRASWPDGAESTVNARTVSGRVDVSSK